MSINAMRSTTCLPNLQTPLVIIVLCLASCNTALGCPRCEGEQVTMEDNVTGKCGCWECPVCREGTGSSVQCGSTVSFDTPITCIPCAPHLTFSNTTGTKQCQPCTVCQNHELVKQECTPESDTECGDCAPGFYRNATTNECLPCSICCPGEKESINKCKEDGGESAGNVCQFDGRCLSPSPTLAHSTPLLTTSILFISATPSFVGGSRMMSSSSQLQATPALTSNMTVISTESAAKDGVTVHKPSGTKDTASSTLPSVVPSKEMEEGVPKDKGSEGWIKIILSILFVLGVGGFIYFMIKQCRSVLNIPCNINCNTAKRSEDSIEAGLLLSSSNKPEEFSSSVSSEDGASLEIDKEAQSVRYSRQRGKHNKKLKRNDNVNGQQPVCAPVGSDAVPLSLDGEDNKLRTADFARFVEEAAAEGCTTIGLGNTSSHGRGVDDLPYSKLQEFYRSLNIIRDFGDDFRGLAERIGLTTPEINSLEKKENPAKSVMTYFNSRTDGTVNTLTVILQDMQRYDILRDVFAGIESHVSKE